MDNSEKIIFFTSKLKELSNYGKGIASSNLKEFEALKQEIYLSLNEKQKIKFNKISFYSEALIPTSYDDLPF